jgi:hypothetical protein
MQIQASALITALMLGLPLAAQTVAQPAAPDVPKIKLMKIESTGLGG